MVIEAWDGCDIGSGGWTRLFASTAVVLGGVEAIAGSGVCLYIVWMLQKVPCKSDVKVATIVGDLPCISARKLGLSWLWLPSRASKAFDSLFPGFILSFSRAYR